MPFPHFKKVSEFSKNEQSKFKSKKGFWKKFFWLALRLAVVGFVIGCLTVAFLFVWYSKDLPNPEKLMTRDIAQSSKIYDSKEETVLYEIHGEEKRTLVKIEEIPDYVKWATVSAEDKYFYEHRGFNLFAMFKGVVIDPLTGKQARGGSTLTQQFVKNAILTNERRVSRKIKEFILSYKIEKKFSKDEILQMYLNEIPYGSMAYGIASASQTFFGKDVEDLSLAESALLAGLPKAPTYYSPYGSNLEDLYNRQHYILDRMVEEGYIKSEEAEAAKNEELHFRLRKETIKAPHFVMYVKEELSEMFGEKLVEQGGLRVITTLDLDKQKIAEEAVVEGVEKRGEAYGFSNAALVALEPATGKILAMVGSKDYFDTAIDGNVNVTTRLRQPGSSIKPLIYAAAFEKGYTPDTILYDVVTNFKTDGPDYIPKNYDLGQRGPVTIRKALQGSLNIPAVKAMYLVGTDNVLNFLEMMGYSSFEDRSRFGLAVVLGGGEVKLLEHVAAFSVFPNEGVYQQPQAILRVEDNKGNVLYEYEEKKRDVLDKNIANIMNNVLSDNQSRAYVFGSNHAMNIGRPAGAKTGTTNDYHDGWTVGYVPQLAAGVWCGNNDNAPMHRGAAGGEIAAPIWHEFMVKSLEGVEVQTFNSFDPPKTDKPILNGKFAVETTVKIDKFSGKLATEYTPESAIEERTYKTIHNILHYVDKDNPQGEAPKNPASDPQYKSWEAAVQAWAANKRDSDDPKDQEEFSFINEKVPTEYDDVHLPENKPTLFLSSPKSNETIDSANLKASVSVSAPRGVYRVEYYLDNTLIQTSYNYPYSLNYYLSSVFVNGYHKLKVIAYDDVDNFNSVEIDVNILVEDRPEITVSWAYPTSGATISGQPITTTVQISDLLAIKKVNFYYRPEGGSFIMYASEIAPQGTSIGVQLSDLAPGKYELKADIETTDDQKYSSNVVSINVE